MSSGVSRRVFTRQLSEFGAMLTHALGDPEGSEVRCLGVRGGGEEGREGGRGDDAMLTHALGDPEGSEVLGGRGRWREGGAEGERTSDQGRGSGVHQSAATGDTFSPPCAALCLLVRALIVAPDAPAARNARTVCARFAEALTWPDMTPGASGVHGCTGGIHGPPDAQRRQPRPPALLPSRLPPCPPPRACRHRRAPTPPARRRRAAAARPAHPQRPPPRRQPRRQPRRPPPPPARAPAAKPRRQPPPAPPAHPRAVPGPRRHLPHVAAAAASSSAHRPPAQRHRLRRAAPPPLQHGCRRAAPQRAQRGPFSFRRRRPLIATPPAAAPPARQPPVTFTDRERRRGRRRRRPAGAEPVSPVGWRRRRRRRGRAAGQPREPRGYGRRRRRRLHAHADARAGGGGGGGGGGARRAGGGRGGRRRCGGRLGRGGAARGRRGGRHAGNARATAPPAPAPRAHVGGGRRHVFRRGAGEAGCRCGGRLYPPARVCALPLRCLGVWSRCVDAPGLPPACTHCASCACVRLFTRCVERCGGGQGVPWESLHVFGRLGGARVAPGAARFLQRKRHASQGRKRTCPTLSPDPRRAGLVERVHVCARPVLRRCTRGTLTSRSWTTTSWCAVLSTPGLL